MQKICSFTQQWKDHFPYQDNMILMPHKLLNFHIPGWGIWVTPRKGRKSYWGCCNENVFFSGASLLGATRGWGEMPNHDMLQWIPAPGNSQVRPESTDLIPTTANLSQSQHFYLLSSLLPSSGELRKKKKLFFYMLVKYNLLNVLCQCIKLPTMLIEYLIDIYLLTSYLC